jgi:hypothetical protein
MLRFKILVSVVPLLVAGVFAREQLIPRVHPCVAAADTSIQIAQFPWQAQQRVAFTTDPALATVRVQIVDSADTADFAVVDDTESSEVSGCESAGPPQFIGIAERSVATPTVIYLTRESDADYRIFVRSKSFTMQEAAALIVGAHAGRQQLASKSL